MASRPSLRREAVEILTSLGWLNGTLHVPAHLALGEHLLLTTQALKLTGVSMPGEPDRLRFLALHHTAVLLVAPALAQEEPAPSAHMGAREVECLLPSGILRGTLLVHASLRLSDHLSLEGPWLTLRHCLLAPYGGTSDSADARALQTAIVNLPKVLGIADAR
jgi:hypothetical protein